MATLTDNSSAYKYLKIISFVTVVTAILLIVIWARVFYGSMQACREGETYLKANQYTRAITFFDRSIHWYTPFNPYVRRSAEGLWEISRRAQAEGDLRLALMAVRAIRRGFIAAGSFYAPGRDWIERCNIRIEDLMGNGQHRRIDPQERSGAKGLVSEDGPVRGPHILWTVIMLTGLSGWIGSVIGLIMSEFGSPPNTRLFSLRTLMWIALWAAFFAVWLVGLMKA